MTTATATKIFADRIGRIEVSATMAITAAALKLKSEGVNLADFGAGGEGRPSLHLAGGRVEDVAEAARRAFHMLSGDEVVELFHGDRP